jgi:glycosyltransferase involved in cell wall biosynthesis
MTPKISVIIPAYRHERYVAEAIESVLGQTAGDFELIIIDDCSEDGTWEIIQRFRDPRIQAFRHEENQGAVKTINEGLRLARGEYLTILNSDDVFHPQRLQVLLDTVRELGAEFVATDVELLEGPGEVMRGKGHGWIEWFEGLKDIHRWAADPVIPVLAGNIAVSTSNLFFSAEVVRRIGYFYEYRYAHDYEFLLRYIADPLAKFCFLEGRKLLFYRLHGANTITESALATRQEVFGLLTRWLADLAPLSDRARVAALARHVIQVEAEIEGQFQHRLGESWNEAARLRIEADDWRYQAEAERERMARLEAELAHWRREAETARGQLSVLRNSHSFRLGHGVLAPLRWARKLLRMSAPASRLDEPRTEG